MVTQPPPNDVIADYLCFSLPMVKSPNDGAAADNARNIIDEFWPELEIAEACNGYGRKPYTGSHNLAIGGMVFYGMSMPHMLVEITGLGCHRLVERGQFNMIANRAIRDSLNITRYDVAVDFETDTDPEDFAAMRGKRWKSKKVFDEPTGKTVYIGARGGEKMARVYRYAPPHERSHLMRVEMEYGKGMAGIVLAQWLDTSDKKELAAALGKSFGWHHPDWTFTSDRKIKGYRQDVKHSKTLRWFRKAVLPAIDRMRGVLGDDHPVWDELAARLPENAQPNPRRAYRGVESSSTPENSSLLLSVKPTSPTLLKAPSDWVGYQGNAVTDNIDKGGEA